MKTLFTCFFLFFFSEFFAQTYSLELNLAEGNDYIQKFKYSSIISQLFDQNELKIDIDFSGSYNFHIDQIEQDVYHMQVSYLNLFMELSMMGNSQEFSSENDTDGNFMSKILYNMTQTSFQIDMTKKGEVLKVTGLNELINSAFSDLDVDENQVAAMRNQMFEGYGEDAFIKNMQNSMSYIPKTAVQPGEKWTVDYTIDKSMELNVKTVYRITETTSDQCVVEGESTLQTTGKGKKQITAETSAQYDLSGTQTSTLTVDLQTGWIVESIVDQTMSGFIIYYNLPGYSKKYKVPMTSTNRIRVYSK